MARIVPSQVVALIDQSFPNAAAQQEGQEFLLTIGHANQLVAIVELVERVPDELITVDAPDFAVLCICVAAIRNQIVQWHARGDHSFNRIGGLPRLSPVTLIRRVMAKCQDEAPVSGTIGLLFISNPELRESIRLDISAANRDLANAEWKGATVLAGAAVEALLLWGLQEQERKEPGALLGAGTALRTSGALTRQPDSNPEHWTLHEYIEAAAYLDLIQDDTAKLAKLTKDFRNLIHPGRAARLGQKCDRGTALSALAAVEHVVRDLTP